MYRLFLVSVIGQMSFISHFFDEICAATVETRIARVAADVFPF